MVGNILDRRFNKGLSDERQWLERNEGWMEPYYLGKDVKVDKMPSTKTLRRDIFCMLNDKQGTSMVRAQWSRGKW